MKAMPEVTELVTRNPSLISCTESIQQAISLMRNCFASGGKLLLCGNGGSAADCDHIVGELMKSFLRPRPIPSALRHELEMLGADGEAIASRLQGGLPCISLVAHGALNFAIANDVCAEMIFAQQTHALGEAGDVLLGLSTSGNSANIINAALVARAKGMQTVVLTGERGGRLAAMADVVVKAPANTVTGIQELHLPIYHAICASLEREFFATS